MATTLWIINLIIWLIIGALKFTAEDADTDYMICWFCLILNIIGNIILY